MRFVALLVALELGALVVRGIIPIPPPPPSVVDGPPEVLRRLEVRLRADLDRPGARGDRYRLFDCREVPRVRAR